MKVETKNLTPKKSRAVVALLECATIKEAAQTAGIGEATLHRWLQDTTFREAYLKARRDAVQQSIANLQRTSSEAVETLRSIMQDTNAPASSRVTAARTVLEQSLKAVELEDFQRRIEALEQAVHNQ